MDSFAIKIRASSLFEIKNFWLLSWKDLMKHMSAPSKKVSFSPGIKLLCMFIAYIMFKCRVKLYI